MKQLLHVDLLVRDAGRSLDFYVDLLGCTIVEDAIVRLDAIATVTRGATDWVRIILLRMPGAVGEIEPMIELMELQPGPGDPAPIRWGSAEGPLPSLFSFSLLVYDVEALLAELRAGGVEPITGVERLRLPRAGQSRLAFVRDPDGNLVELVDVR